MTLVENTIPSIPEKKSFFPPGHANFYLLTVFFFITIFSPVFSQEVNEKDSAEVKVVDATDVLKKIFKKKPDTATKKKSESIALLPSIGYNPSFGFVFGAKASVLKQFDEGSDLSAFGLEASYSTKKIITAQARHNVFLDSNNWNIQGNWQLSRFLITDYSIGTGTSDYKTKSDSAFPIRFTYLRFTEKIYRKIGKHTFAGFGVNFNIRKNIDDEKLDSMESSPHLRYSLRNDFDPTRYSANSFLVGFAYITKEHPLRAYSGTFFDVNLVINRKLLGSTKNSLQLVYDLRKYVGLSKKNPEHVLAFWHIGSYNLNGTLPYLALPATGYDIYNRSGRGYTIGRFKGPSFAYFESEYRFPITPNKLFSGVTFINLQTASDDMGKKLFQYWEPAVGAGLRILFQKESRSTICIDYVRGKYGSEGLFFGLNEAF